MKKLLLVIPTLDQSGAEKQFTMLATGLPKSEFAVHVVCLTHGGPYEETLKAHGIPVTVLDKRFKFDPVALWRLRSFIRNLQPDIVHSWLFAANSYLRLIAGNRDMPRIVISERCVDSWKSDWQLWLDRRQIRRTHRLIANSESVAVFYREHGFPAERTTVIPNGVEIPQFTPEDRAAILREFDIPAASAVVGSVGRLAKQKRGKDIAWSMQLLRQLRENVHLLVVGDGPERRAMYDLVDKTGCAHLVRFAGHRSDASRLFAAFDVFWLASDFEGMSNSLMEAMAAGIPVVVSDIPPNRELVEDGKQGFIAKVGDNVGFAQFTDRILADPELRSRLGNAARERMQTEFRIEKMIERHVTLYRDILDTTN